MVGNRRADEVVDENLDVKPATRALKRALLVALRCVDPDSEKRPKMSQVVQMLEADEFPYREVRINSCYVILICILINFRILTKSHHVMTPTIKTKINNKENAELNLLFSNDVEVSII